MQKGWDIGHSYAVYGPLLLGCTSVIFEGKSVGTPDESTYWRVYTTPKSIKDIKRIDTEGKSVNNINISSLKRIYLVGDRGINTNN
jgi:propionyl-CoA synthetase